MLGELVRGHVFDMRAHGALFSREVIFLSYSIFLHTKDGGRFDLAIALGVLAASEQVPAASLAELECLGELALSGELRPVQGVLPAALAARAAGRTLVVPRANAEEASLASGLRVLAVDHLLQIAAHLNGHTPLSPYQANGLLRQEAAYPDLAEVQGQLAAKRALLIAASGGHNLLLSGPPGTGKTLLASRLPGLLPPLSEEEALEVAAIHSVASHAPLTAWPRRPFRQPHHSASGPALVGGGSRPQPGEISLAHHGILFLDELPEFDRKVLEVLREPLESGHIVIARARDKVRFPARFQLVAAMNPCPCGYLGDPGGRCRCTPEQIQRYRAKLSGPLLDRIDLHLTVARESTSLLASSQAGENSAQVAASASSRARAAPMPSSTCRACSSIAACPKPTGCGWNRPANASTCRCGRPIACSRWRAPWPTWKAPARSAARTWPRPCSTGPVAAADPAG
ncbi:magnesium chelatase family protein [Aquipseudomonas alcaligenes]|uniref:Magnesium chelatase family protein n=1 Tax=Aquipseudomonas alcaligenes TaxID=43263 RepID=A0A1N6NND4_AQUAC|nr:magnesium chelatase family protein [Pseudomonas alcaligenes]